MDKQEYLDIKYKKRLRKEVFMKKKVLIAIIVAIGILAGCGKEDSVPSNTNGVEELESHDMSDQADSEPEESAEPEERTDDGFIVGGENHPIKNREVVDGKMQSYLTGEWKDAEVAQRRAMAVMIPNNYLKGSTVPQHGISNASIIYEAPVEGRITRLMAVFEDYDTMEKLGPVRSSRDYYVYEAMAMDAIYCNWGLAVPYVSDLINSDKVDNISVQLEGIKNGFSEGQGQPFGRGLNPGYSTEFTSSLNIEGYTKAVEKRGYATTYAEREGKQFKQVFTFTDEGYLATYENYPDATVIYPGGTTSNSGGYGSRTGDNAIRFDYNEEERLYYRYQYGEPHVDVDNGEQLAVTNIVFKVCHGEVRDNHDYLAFRVHGTGTAYIFTNGKVIEGTWSHSGDNEPNIFYDKNGNEIVLNQGKTWFCCIWEEFSEYMSWE